MGDLHTNIMNLKADPEMLETLGRGRSADYKLGFKDARHAAAEQAALDAAEARADSPLGAVATDVLNKLNLTALLAHAIDDGAISDEYLGQFQQALDDQNAALAPFARKAGV